MSVESWKLTLPCTRAEAELLAVADLGHLDPAPVLNVSEPDESKPDAWQLDAYFEGRPSRIVIRRVAELVPSARRIEPRAVQVVEQDWVTLSQGGFAPMQAGRFRVRTPEQAAASGDFVIPAGLAFGTGQHATTKGCLEALDRLKRQGKIYRNMIDVGTGTGLLAFAAMRLWPSARATASDIDPISVRVVRENMALNGVSGLDLFVADGLIHRELVARAPYDLVVANILAGPLIDMAPHLAAALAPRGTLLLAGLLDTQAAAVTRAYRRERMMPVASSGGEWPVLELRKR
ncbi:Ribosomal protein L11 methyltransferase [Sphingomonas antarctica]|uniref:50S ribosomal protein L11 methyltransferase n=1 Tax=Sphingomonas antarctica TaxID=2040274 RepID=UPI0039ECCB9B